MTDAYQLEFDRVIGQVLERRATWIEDQLAALNPGETLCIHDDQSDWNPRSDQFAVRHHAHVLAAGVTCDEPGRREQYGPMPADWREVVDEMNSRRAS